MANDDRNILDLLSNELGFIEKGGYGRRVKTPWKPTSIFQDSLTCVNFGFSSQVNPCSGCHLIDFVPSEARAETVPCHHIPLNKAGETIDELETQGNQQRLEESVKAWLRTKIRHIGDADSHVQEKSSGPGDWMTRYGPYSFDLNRFSGRPPCGQ